MKERARPILYFNVSKEDREVYLAVRQAVEVGKIDVDIRASASDGPGLDENPTRPLMTVGYSHYMGKNEIFGQLQNMGVPPDLLESPSS